MCYCVSVLVHFMRVQNSFKHDILQCIRSTSSLFSLFIESVSIVAKLKSERNEWRTGVLLLYISVVLVQWQVALPGKWHLQST